MAFTQERAIFETCVGGRMPDVAVPESDDVEDDIEPPEAAPRPEGLGMPEAVDLSMAARNSGYSRLGICYLCHIYLFFIIKNYCFF